MTDLDLAAIRQRVEKATEGPWAFASAPAEGSDETKAEYMASALTDDGPLFVVWVPETEGREEGYTVPAITGDGPKSSYNAEFIAHAREDIPALLGEIDRLNATIQRVRELSHEWSVSITCDAVIDLDIEIVQPLVRALEGGEQ